MKIRIIVVLLALGIFGWLALLLIQHQLGVGGFGESPHVIHLRLGRRAIVGGGRAVLTFVADKRKEATLEVRCADATSRIDVVHDVLSDEVCGVRVRLVKRTSVFQDSSAGRRFEVSWEE